MKITIGNTIPSPHKPDTYEVEITVMHGDGNASTSFTVGPFENHQTNLLENLLQTLTIIKNAYPDGRSWYDTYDDIDGYLNWFQNNPTTEELLEPAQTIKEFKNSINHKKEWPADITFNELKATYENHQVYYYDADLNKHEVEVTL